MERIITVLTAPGQPKFEVPLDWGAARVAEKVLIDFGKQPSNASHNWRGDNER